MDSWYYFTPFSGGVPKSPVTCTFNGTSSVPVPIPSMGLVHFNIYLHLMVKYGFHVGKYAVRPMDGMGYMKMSVETCLAWDDVLRWWTPSRWDEFGSDPDDATFLWEIFEGMPWQQGCVSGCCYWNDGLEIPRPATFWMVLKPCN